MDVCARTSAGKCVGVCNVWMPLAPPGRPGVKGAYCGVSDMSTALSAVVGQRG